MDNSIYLKVENVDLPNLVGKKYQVGDNSWQHCINTGKKEYLYDVKYHNSCDTLANNSAVVEIFTQPKRVTFKMNIINENVVHMFFIGKDEFGRLHRILFEENQVLN